METNASHSSEMWRSRLSVPEDSVGITDSIKTDTKILRCRPLTTGTLMRG